MAFTKLARDVFAGHDLGGSPRRIDPQDAAKWGTEIEALANLSFSSGRVYSTKAAMDGDLSPVANTPAIVSGDPTPGNDGLYRKVGGTGTGSWVKVLDFVPGTQFVFATDTGAGTPNAIIATTDRAVSASGSQLVVLSVFEPNTGSPVTLSLPGLPTLTIKTQHGNDPGPGGLVAGPYFGRVEGTTFRLLTDVVDASIVAAAEAAQQAAEDARDAALAAVPNAFPATLAALKALDTGSITSAYLKDQVRGGQFAFRAGDFSDQVDSDPLGAVYVEADDTDPASGAWVRIFNGPVMADWFGVSPLASPSDNYARIIAARDFCWANGNVTLAMQDGVYEYDTTLDLAQGHWAFLALGANVVLKFTGTGVAVELNGLNRDPNYGVFGFTFGGENRFKIVGNPNCTKTTYINNSHHSDIKADAKECNTIAFHFEDTPGGAADFGSAVRSHFNLRISQGNDGLFTTVPAVGLYGDDLYNCDLTLLIEHVGGGGNPGLLLNQSQGNTIRGTVEGCVSGGIALSPTAIDNKFEGVWCEYNGTGPDWVINGNGNTLTNCKGVGTAGTLGTSANIIYGDRNIIDGGEFWDLEIDAGADNTLVTLADLTGGTVTNNSATTRFVGCAGVADTAPPPAPIAPTLTSGFTNYSAGYRVAGYYRDRSGHVRVEGTISCGTVSLPQALFTLPVGYRPSELVYFPGVNISTGAGTIMQVGSNGVVSITAGAATGNVIAIDSIPIRPS